MNDADPFRQRLLRYFEDWPESRLQDLIKLIYQQNFGGGHLISDEAKSLARLQDEVFGLPLSEGESPPLIEPIGNGLCRVHLRGLAASGLRVQTLNRMVVHSASVRHDGSRKLFKEKLDQLAVMLADGILPFDPDELARWITGYDFDACLPVRHSDAFRLAYRPAYRILLREYGDFFQVFAAIDRLFKQQQPLLVGIDGRCGSGKSTLADLLAVVFDAALIRMDHFFLPAGLKTPERLAEPGGNIDYARFADEITPGLKRGQPFHYRPYDCQTGAFGQPILVEPARLTVIEGSYSLHPKLGISYNLSVFLRIDPTEQLHRIRLRSGPALAGRFQSVWIPMEEAYFSTWKIAESSNLVLDLKAAD